MGADVTLEEFREFIASFDSVHTNIADKYKHFALNGTKLEIRKLIGQMFNANLVPEIMDFYNKIHSLNSVGMNMRLVTNSMKDNEEYKGHYVKSLIYTLRGLRTLYPDDVGIQISLVFKYRAHHYVHTHQQIIDDKTLKHNEILTNMVANELREEYKIKQAYLKKATEYLKLQYLSFPRLHVEESIVEYIEAGVVNYKNRTDYLQSLERVLMGNSILKARKDSIKPDLELSYYSQNLIQRITQINRKSTSTGFAIPQSVIRYITERTGVKNVDLVLEGITKKGILDKYLIDRLISEVS